MGALSASRTAGRTLFRHQGACEVNRLCRGVLAASWPGLTILSNVMDALPIELRDKLAGLTQACPVSCLGFPCLSYIFMFRSEPCGTLFVFGTFRVLPCFLCFRVFPCFSVFLLYRHIWFRVFPCCKLNVSFPCFTVFRNDTSKFFLVFLVRSVCIISVSFRVSLTCLPCNETISV